MKKKELKKLASQIAQAEFDLQESSDPELKQEIKKRIMKLSSRITSLEDIMILDELIQNELKEKSS
jgi:hypothetical protein